MDKKYIDFGVTPYALPAVLLALSNNDVHTFFVTQEDGDLHIRIDEEVLMNAVYHIKCYSESSNFTCCPATETPDRR